MSIGFIGLAKNIINTVCNKIVGESSDKKVEAEKTHKTNPKQADNVKNKTDKMNKSLNSVYATEDKKSSTENVGDILVKEKSTEQAKAKTIEQDKPKTQQVQTNKTNNKKKHLSVVTEKDIENLTKSIKIKSKKTGISDEEIKKNVLESMNQDLEWFEQASLENKFRVLSGIDAALNMQITSAKENEDFEENIDKNAFITKVAANYIDLITNGGISDIKSFQAKINNTIDNAYKKLEKAETDEEKAEILNNARENVIKEIEAEYEKQNANNVKKDKETADKERRIRKRGTERALENGFYGICSRDEIKWGGHLRSGEDMDEAIQNGIDVASEKIKSDVANSEDHEFITSMADFKYRHGDEVPADVYGRAVGYSMQYKTYDAAQQFEQDAYEFRKRVENGEIDAPWMSEEHFKAESTAIGTGITDNKYMSGSEKAELLNSWDKHISEFSDYYDIKDAYNKAMISEASEDNNIAQEYEKIKTILVEDYNNKIDTIPNAWKKRYENIPEAKSRISETELKLELKTKSVSEIKKTYTNSMHEIAEIILKNDVQYKNRIDDIVDYLNCYSGKEIGLMAVGCSISTISKLIQKLPEKAHDILDIVAPTMCFTGKQIVENIAEKGNNNEAA